MRWWLGGVVALLCQGQQELPRDLALLGQIRLKVAQNLKQLPNYTCLETIDRFDRTRSERNPAPLDRVRLQVAYLDGKELYGRPETSRIDQAELRNVVRGTIGGGGFATIVQEIILGPSATFHFEGDTELEGRPAVLYSFHVARLVSGYRITTPSGSGVLGYAGRFWADASSMDMMRVELAADDIPLGLRLSAASEWIEYRRIAIGSSNFLLPHSSEMILKDTNGSEATNRTSFADCHQFAAESVLSFTEIPSEPVTPAPKTVAESQQASEVIDLPAEFTVEISLDTPIDSDSAAVGDPIAATLRQNVKAGKAIIAPKGAKLSGWIARLEHEHGTYSMDLEFRSLDFKNGHVDMIRRKNEVVMRVTHRFAPSSSSQGYPVEQVIDSESPLVFETKHLKLPRGTRLILRSKKESRGCTAMKRKE